MYVKDLKFLFDISETNPIKLDLLVFFVVD